MLLTKCAVFFYPFFIVEYLARKMEISKCRMYIKMGTFLTSTVALNDKDVEDLIEAFRKVLKT